MPQLEIVKSTPYLVNGKVYIRQEFLDPTDLTPTGEPSQISSRWVAPSDLNKKIPTPPEIEKFHASVTPGQQVTVSETGRLYIVDANSTPVRSLQNVTVGQPVVHPQGVPQEWIKGNTVNIPGEQHPLPLSSNAPTVSAPSNLRPAVEADAAKEAATQPANAPQTTGSTTEQIFQSTPIDNAGRTFVRTSVDNPTGSLTKPYEPRPLRNDNGDVLGWEVPQLDGTVRSFSNAQAANANYQTIQQSLAATQNLERLGQLMNTNPQGISLIDHRTGKSDNLLYQDDNGIWKFENRDKKTTHQFKDLDEAKTFAAGFEGSQDPNATKGAATGASGSGKPSKDVDPAGGAGVKKPSVIDRILSHPGVQITTAVLAGAGVYAGVKSLATDFSWGAAIGTGLSGAFFFKSAFDLGNRYAGGHGALVGTGVLAGIVAYAIFRALQARRDRDNGLNATLGDVGQTANANPQWYRTLPSQNVFMITTATALMAVGINLSIEGPSVQSLKVASVKLPEVHATLQKSIGTQQLSAVPTSVLGKVFLQQDGDQAKVVYVSQLTTKTDGTPDYAVNMVTLNYDGYLIGPSAPPDSHISMFRANAQGAIEATPEANNALANQFAMAQVANTANPAVAAAATTASNAPFHGATAVSK